MLSLTIFGVLLCSLPAAEPPSYSFRNSELGDYTWVPKNGDVFHFQVEVSGKTLGYQQLRFDRIDSWPAILQEHGNLPDDVKGDRWQVTVNVRFRYKILGFTVFRYDHQNMEYWSIDDRKNRPEASFWGLVSRTNNDGEKHFVVASWTGESYKIRHNEKEPFELSRLFPGSYWHPATIRQERLFNPQDATTEPTPFNFLGRQSYPLQQEDGREIAALAYRADSRLPITLWYAEKDASAESVPVKKGEWMGMKFTSEKDRLIRYFRKNPAADLRAPSIKHSESHQWVNPVKE